MTARNRLRVRKDNRSTAQREYDFAYRKGYNVGIEDRDEQNEKKIVDLLRNNDKWEEDYCVLLRDIDELKEMEENTQKTINDLYQQLRQAEAARDGWRKQVTELLFEVKEKK